MTETSVILSAQGSIGYTRNEKTSNQCEQFTYLNDEEVVSISSETSIRTCNQLTLKDNYVKAKREREIEQEQAELEKKRLQEILDLCIEFQRQESLKSTSNIIAKDSSIQPSSTSSSLSSSGPTSSSSSESIKQKPSQNQLIETLPKLTSVLNLNPKQNQINLNSQQQSSNQRLSDQSTSIAVEKIASPKFMVIFRLYFKI